METRGASWVCAIKMWCDMCASARENQIMTLIERNLHLEIPSSLPPPARPRSPFYVLVLLLGWHPTVSTP